jgi:hypothetical protein
MAHFHHGGHGSARGYNPEIAQTSTDDRDMFHGWSDIASGDLDETILCCGICLENYLASSVVSSTSRGRNPKLLNCLHTFCRGCLTDIAAVEGGFITCRKCHGVTNVKNLPGGVHGLKDDFTIQHLLEMMVDYSEGSTSAPQCGNCDDGNPTTWGCLHCCDESTGQYGVPLCEQCYHNHCRVKQFKMHEVLPIEQYLPRVAMQRKNQPVKCLVHPQKDIEFCCEICHVPVCPQCVITGAHSGHRMQSLQDAAEAQRSMLRERLTSVDTAVAGISATRSELIEKVRQFDDNVTAVHNSVDMEIDELIRLLDVRRQRAHEEIDAKASGKIRRAKANIEHLGTQIVAARQCSEFVERGVHYGSDLEIYETSPLFQVPMQTCVEIANSLDINDSLQFENIGLTIASTKEQVELLCYLLVLSVMVMLVYADAATY